MTKQMTNVIKDAARISAKYLHANTEQTKNLSEMSPAEAIKTFRNPNMLKTNSEKYLTYKFKQNIKMDSEFPEMFHINL